MGDPATKPATPYRQKAQLQIQPTQVYSFVLDKAAPTLPPRSEFKHNDDPLPSKCAAHRPGRG